MLHELISALFKAGLPIAAASYGLVWWALRNNYLEPPGSVGDMEKETKRLAKDKETKKNGDLVHNKWMAFGGGFYGVVGVLTYLFVELGEIRDFFAQFGGFSDLFSRLSLDLLVRLFIDSIMNFVVAIAWPVYWIGDFAGKYIWLWLVVAYSSYWAGARMALHVAQRRSVDAP